MMFYRKTSFFIASYILLFEAYRTKRVGKNRYNT